MMTAFGVLVILMGLFLLLYPAVWCRLNAPEDKKNDTPDARTMRSVRMRGMTFTLGGLALLAVQLWRGLSG